MYSRRVDRRSRSGVILPLLVVCLTALCGFLALSVDVGMIAVAKTECQDAADLAALAGARTLDGSSTPNLSGATANAKAAAASNTILSTTVPAANVTATHGSYHYDSTSQTFSPAYPASAPDPYDLTKATVTFQSQGFFSTALGFSGFNVSATAVAAHRPRDVAIVLDFSGSMNDESDLWNNVQPAYSYLGNMDNTPNNKDPVIPTWGPYSATASANIQCTSSDPRVGQCNNSQAALGIPSLVSCFYQHSRGSSAASAFTPASSNYATTPGGDYYLKKNNSSGSPWAVTFQDINNGSTTKNSSFETSGYDYYYVTKNSTPAFQGYIQGPNYWGKTFFIWPPDPRPALDWRAKFFLKPGGSYPAFGGAVTSNTSLFDSSGNWLTPPNNYVINYKAILAWIANTGPNPFPTTRLRGGRIAYYSNGIPTDVPVSAYDHTQPNSSITDPGQRFWKEYIDYCLGVYRDPYGNINTPGMISCSYVPDFTWGTVQITSKPTGTSVAYMNYADNPKRPAHRMWFGPMTMIQYMSDCGLLPGNATDISLYPAKLGMAGALQDIQNNHPNDTVSLILYNRPQFSNDVQGVGAFNQAVANLNRNYQSMIDSLWFPPNSSSADVTPWDANGSQTPRAAYDYMYNTAISHGMMLAYNQFSSSTTVQAAGAGGFGRKGAQRLVILETDGIANVESIPGSGFYSSGISSYYHILPGETLNTNFNYPYNPNLLLQNVQAICNKIDGTPGNTPGYSSNPGYPGFSTSTKPVKIHTIAFGAMFEPTASGSDQTTAVSLLQQISQIGGTVFPSSASDPTNGFKWCIGTESQRQALLRQAFMKIMDDGAAITLIQ